MKKHHMKTYADAHNHLWGILPVDSLKIMLSQARIHWDRENFKYFGSIPEELVPNAECLSFSNSSVTIEYGWLDCLDIIARLIVFNVIDIQNQDSEEQSHGDRKYQRNVRDMLCISDGSANGRGMNGAGLVLAGCIALRCLVDNAESDDSRPIDDNLRDIDRCIAYLQDLDHQSIDLGSLFVGACLIDTKKGLSADNWLFSKFRICNHDPCLQSFAEQIAVSSSTAALSTSLWAPFDDCYALRGLLRRGYKNSVNYLMLTFRWLLEKEAIKGNYFSEISIGLGDLDDIFKKIEKHAVDFGFAEISAGGIDRNKYLPLILEKNPQLEKCRVRTNHNNRLYVRFLSGFLNSLAVRWDSDVDAALAEGLKKIKADQVYGCWAGVDMFGIENFVYDRSKFIKWLDTMYHTLRDIQIYSGGERRLWLRPHVGEGAWAEDLPARISKCDTNPLSLARKLKSLADFFSGDLLKTKNPVVFNEVLEFIYRSIFTGWLPIDDIRVFYGGKAFTNLELQRLSALLQPVDPEREALGEKIGTANLEIMIDWVNHISPQTIEQFDRNYPQIRFGHGTHLGFDSVWGAVTGLNASSFLFVWVDLNLGSNIVTSARSIRSTIDSEPHSKHADHSLVIEDVVRKAINHARFTCGYIQTELVERSERIAKFIDLLRKHGILFVLGTDGQGTELTSLFREQLHFHKLMNWYYKDRYETEFMNKMLKSNINRYISYAIGNVSELVSLEEKYSKR